MRENELVELTNMCMIYKDGKVLVQNRVGAWPGIAFPGGHIETRESIVDSVIREIKEETGLDIKNVKLCGVKQWFKKDVRNICFMFKTCDFSGELKSNEEGENFWIEESEIETYELASNFNNMYKVFKDDKLMEHYHPVSGSDDFDILR